MTKESTDEEHGRRPFRWKAVVLGLFVVLAGVLAVYYGLLFRIDSDAEAIAANACLQYSGDGVEALIALAESEERSLRDRNHAIWALGRLRDARVVPALEALYTGEPCDHDRSVCQYELTKTLANCRGETFDPIFWR